MKKKPIDLWIYLKQLRDVHGWYVGDTRASLVLKKLVRHARRKSK